jgi:lipopolysaccharide transport system permease protein
MTFIKDILRFRGLIYAITLREIKSRYAGSTFGPLWLIVPPVFMVTIYTVIFARLMQARLPGIEHQYAYSIYLCAGLITWNLLLELVQRGKGVFLEHANLIKKSNFPKFILFIPVIAVALLNTVMLLVLVLGFMLVSGYPVSMGTLLIFPLLAITVVLGIAVGALLATLNVFFRDIGQLTDVFFQALFWATPIVYPLSILSEPVARLLSWNPVFSLVLNAQKILLGEPISRMQLVYPLVFGVIVFFLAVLLYKRSYNDLLDQI